jgi:flagellar biosynthesis/type III secretory pathway protein FliH
MSKDNRALKFEEIKQLLKKDGNFVQDTRFERTPDPSFKPWGKQSFRVINEFVPEPEPEAVTPSREDAPEAELAATIVEEATASELPPPPPPPVETETPPDPQAIIAALEQAREDGRALGYQQGLDAAKRELGDALGLIRKMEAELTMLSAEALDRNATAMAQHVRRLAQELFGTTFAQMPEAFVERIRNAAEMFTKASTDFTIFLSPRDLHTLETALKKEPIFTNIRVMEDDELPSGAFRLASRDLDYEDTPEMDGTL